MRNMPMCPMMMHNMPMMPQMQMPMGQMPMMQMPMGQMPMMQMPMEMVMPYDEDEKDEEYFEGMYGENGHMMMPHVTKVIDRMEEKNDKIYENYPDREMIDRMTEEAYNNMTKEMPEMSDDMEEERQFHGRRRLARDLVGILLINELLRRRRRRRHHHGYPGYGGSPYDNDYDYDYDDFYYSE